MANVNMESALGRGESLKSLLLDSRVELSPDGVNASYDFSLPEDLLFFKGHFFDRPILPGVVQLNWVMECLEDFQLGEFSSLTRLKFMKPIFPNTPLTLNITSKNSSSVKFRYFNSSHNFSSGNVLLASPNA
ncbi:MAG: hypothetical protein COA42_23385 [Alteromonadaceae bacterium]|nr:MAG: hypothetical protein COA42_23385 [Alteromonadaceae bacterium]